MGNKWEICHTWSEENRSEFKRRKEFGSTSCCSPSFPTRDIKTVHIFSPPSWRELSLCFPRPLWFTYSLRAGHSITLLNKGRWAQKSRRRNKNSKTIEVSFYQSSSLLSWLPHIPTKIKKMMTYVTMLNLCLKKKKKDLGEECQASARLQPKLLWPNGSAILQFRHSHLCAVCCEEWSIPVSILKA